MLSSIFGIKGISRLMLFLSMSLQKVALRLSRILLEISLRKDKANRVKGLGIVNASCFEVEIAHDEDVYLDHLQVWCQESAKNLAPCISIAVPSRLMSMQAGLGI